MPPTGPSDEVRAAFRHALLQAIIEGRMPPRYCRFGPLTWSAIEAIAQDHPEASASLIADAYDIFRRENSAAA